MKQKEHNIAVIGGSGVYQLDNVKKVNEHSIDTPFGKPSSKIIEGLVENQKCFFLPRHGIHHNITPSEVNYRANIYALKTLGVKYVISVSAVGSLKEECPPRSFVLPDQFIDWTKGKRERTFFEKGMVGHTSVANPINLKLHAILKKACEKIEISHKASGSYICIEGPQFSSKAESQIYRNFGATIIGMTNVPESYLAMEAGMAYATVAMVTDYDCWKEEHCTLEEIMNVMKDNNISVKKLLSWVIPYLGEHKFDFVAENANSVVTHTEVLSEDHKKILKVLMD